MQIEYKSPGVYGVEKTPARAAEGLSPAKMGIVGWTDKGPSNYPIQVTSVEEFTTAFGPISRRGVLPLEIRGFFGTGGQKAWVTRVVPADAVAASVAIDSSPGPTKWTYTANGEGVWGNDLKVLIRGNRNFLDRVTNQWDKFDVLILQPSDFDPTVDEADEVYEQVQFTDSSKFDYITNVLNDPRKPSLLVKLTAGAGGTPTNLLNVTIPAETIGTGGGAPLASRFVATLANVPCLDNTLIIKAVSRTLKDKTLVPTLGTIDGSTTEFNFQVSLGDLPVVEGSLSTLYQKKTVTNALVIPTTGIIDGVDTAFTADAGVVVDPVHREIATFKLKYAAVAGASPQTLAVIGGVAATLDLSTTPLTSTPVHPGTVSIAVNVNGAGLATITDNGAGQLIGNGGALPVSGTINYVTGVMTGITAALTAFSTVVATYNMSLVITKRAQVNLPLTTVVGVPLVGDTVTVGAATGIVAFVSVGNTYVDVNVTAGVFAPGAAAFAPSLATATVVAPVTPNNLAQAVALIGSIDLLGVNTINLVDSVTVPTAAGAISFKTFIAPIAGTNFYLDYVVLGFSNSDFQGVMSGDVASGSTTNFDTGQIVVTFSNPPLTGSTVEFTYQQGQLVQDNGIGYLIGDINPLGNNRVDYNLGTIDVTFSTAPPSGTPIVASYVKLAHAIQFQMTGGNDGSAVSRSDVTDPALAVDKKGIYALDLVEEPLNVVVPDFEGSEFVQADIVDFCDSRQDRFAIMGFANGTTVDEALQYVLVTQAFDTRNAAIYYPNIYFINDLTGLPELIPCTGFVAGVYAKTASNKNIGKSPGGLIDGALDSDGTVGPEIKVDLAARDRLYSARINPLMTSAATGFVVWGVRSLSKDPRWRYINARLLNNFLMHRLKLNLQWVVFENNGPALWVKITTAIEGYLSSLFRLGYFQGETKEQAYFVKCDARNNNQGTIDAGKVLIDTGFSPNKPAEFCIFTLSQPAGGSTTTI